MRRRRGTGLVALIASVMVFIAGALLFYTMYSGVEGEQGELKKLASARKSRDSVQSLVREKTKDIAKMRLALGGSLRDQLFFEEDGGGLVPSAINLVAYADAQDHKVVNDYNDSRKRADPNFQPTLAARPGWEQTFPAEIAQFAKNQPTLQAALASHTFTFETGTFGDETIVYYPNILHLHKDMVEIIRACTQYLAARGTDRGSAYQQITDRSTSREEAIKREREAIAEARTRLNQRQQEYIDDISRRDREIASLVVDLAEKQADLGRLGAEKIRDEAKLQEEIDVLSSRIADLLKKKEKAKSETAADGEIVHVDESLGFAWVDLAYDDGVRPGMKFEVFAVLKGGRKQIKGMIEIREVGDQKSKASIIEGYTVYDPERQESVALPARLNPIVRGDRIRSPFFDPEEQPIFVFVGTKLTNGIYSYEELGIKISEIGGRVDKTITIETDFIVAVDHAEEQPEFRTALQFGIEIMRERDLMKYLRR